VGNQPDVHGRVTADEREGRASSSATAALCSAATIVVFIRQTAAFFIEMYFFILNHKNICFFKSGR
jgi:hypothetical protein